MSYLKQGIEVLRKIFRDKSIMKTKQGSNIPRINSSSRFLLA